MIRIMMRAFTVVTVGLFAATTGAAAPAPGTAPNTHMGQPAGQMVTLEAIGAPGTCSSGGPFSPFLPLEFVRNLANGMGAGFPPSGAIPPVGKVFVVTDVDWQASGAPNSTTTLRLFRVNLANSSSNSRVFESTIHLDATGAGGISEGATAGFVVSSAATICVDVVPGGLLQHLLLRGYLAPDLP